MKTEFTTLKSAEGAQHTAIKKADELATLLTAISNHGQVQEKMPKVRAVLAELNQRVHEFNAYVNVLETE